MLGIYVHLPFCRKKCPYCSFNSYSGAEELIPRYMDSIVAEIEEYDLQSADTVYFGGGTPTVCGAERIARLLDAVAKRFDIAGGSEITIEANPGTVGPKKLRALKDAGFNRISIGLQSLVPAELSGLGRIHTAAEAENAVTEAYDAGFENIAADLMFGTPGQTMATLGFTLDRLLRLPVSHVSAYSLSIDEGTEFHARKEELELPDEDTERGMYRRIIKRLGVAGFAHYEISGFAKPGMESRHNMKYWTGGEYIGLGAGAHSYYNGKRYSNPQTLEEYMDPGGRARDGTVIDENERAKEYYMLGLRLIRGVKERAHPNIEKLARAGLIERRDGMVRLTARGLDLANYVFSELM